MKKTFKRLLSLSLACAMLLSMGVTAFASESYVVDHVGTIDESGMIIVDSKVLEVLEDGSYIVASTLKSPFATFATGGSAVTIKYDFKRNSGVIYHTIKLHGDFTFDNTAKKVQFGDCSYESIEIEDAGATFSNFAQTQTFGISNQTAKYTLKFNWKTYLGTGQNKTMYIQCDYNGKLTSSGNTSSTES